MKKTILIFVAMMASFVYANAQEWMKVFRTINGTSVSMPLEMQSLKEFEVKESGQQLRALTLKGDSTEMAVDFDVTTIDSIGFANDLADEEKGHNKHRVFTLTITTEDEAPIAEKEVWVNCHFSLDGMGEYSDFSGTGRIRGRGNSTWEWYDKKPYKFKLDEKSKLLGMEKAKDWNLLANYRDVTDLMNVYAFEVARCMGMPHTNHTRFVEVYLNGDYIGVYQLTEKIEVDKNRVNIDKDGGILLSFDLDDGPSLSPNDGDNFWSQVYKLPMSVKHPDEPSKAKLDSVKADFALLENAIKSKDYVMVDSLMDIESFIHILQLHEYLYNVEIDAPRSLYMWKDKGGKYTFGPVWDWDAGYDFDWTNMMTGHRFFDDYHELIYGTMPAKHVGAAYNVSGFWTDMFANNDFVDKYKSLWNDVKDSLMTVAWTETDLYREGMSKGAYNRDIKRWPLKGMSIGTEITKMKTWLENRLSYINNVIANYPGGTKTDTGEGDKGDTDKDSSTITVEGNTIKVTQTLIASNNYHQPTVITIPQSTVTSLLGGDPDNLYALNTDGEQGSNTAAKTYGAWFDQWGNTNQWAYGHVFIESDDLYEWSFGSHPDNCHAGDTHTVRMQYSRGYWFNAKTIDVEVTFVVK